MSTALALRLIASGAVSAADAEGALLSSLARRVPFVRALIDTGAIGEAVLDHELEQLGGIGLRQVSGMPELVNRLPPHFCRRMGVLPVRVDHGQRVVEVAAADPMDAHIAAEVGFHLGVPVRVLRAPIAAIEEAIRRIELEAEAAAGRTRRATPPFPHGAPESSNPPPPPQQDAAPIPLMKRSGERPPDTLRLYKQTLRPGAVTGDLDFSDAAALEAAAAGSLPPLGPAPEIDDEPIPLERSRMWDPGSASSPVPAPPDSETRRAIRAMRTDPYLKARLVELEAAEREGRSAKTDPNLKARLAEIGAAEREGRALARTELDLRDEVAQIDAPPAAASRPNLPDRAAGERVGGPGPDETGERVGAPERPAPTSAPARPSSKTDPSLRARAAALAAEIDVPAAASLGGTPAPPPVEPPAVSFPSLPPPSFVDKPALLPADDWTGPVPAAEPKPEPPPAPRQRRPSRFARPSIDIQIPQPPSESRARMQRTIWDVPLGPGEVRDESRAGGQGAPGPATPSSSQVATGPAASAAPEPPLAERATRYELFDTGPVLESLRAAGSRDDVVVAALRGLRTVGRRAAIFVVRRDGFHGWACNVELGDQEKLRAVSVPSTAPSVFATAVATGSYFGPIPANAVHAPLLAVLEQPSSDVAVAVARAGGKPVMLLFADDLVDIKRRVLPRLVEISDAVGAALSRLLAARL